MCVCVCGGIQPGLIAQDLRLPFLCVFAAPVLLGCYFLSHRGGALSPLSVFPSFAASPPVILWCADVCNVVRVFCPQHIFFVVVVILFVFFCLSLFFSTFSDPVGHFTVASGSRATSVKKLSSLQPALGYGRSFVVSAGRRVLVLCQIGVR